MTFLVYPVFDLFMQVNKRSYKCKRLLCFLYNSVRHIREINLNFVFLFNLAVQNCFQFSFLFHLFLHLALFSLKENLKVGNLRFEID